MTLKVFIPTLSRTKTLFRGTLKCLPLQQLSNSTLVVQKHEYDAYYKVVAAAGYEGVIDIMTLPSKIKRIAETRYFIGQHCEGLGIEKFVMLDDDLRFYIRTNDPKYWWRLRSASHDEVAELFDLVEEDLETWSHVSVSARENNAHKRDFYITNNRYMRFLGYRTSAYMSCYHKRIEVMEDFDVALQLIRKGLPSKIYYNWAQGQQRMQAKGGCSLWRTLEIHNDAAERLAELHPGFVGVVTKNRKSEIGVRKDVRIRWQKAFG